MPVPRPVAPTRPPDRGRLITQLTIGEQSLSSWGEDGTAETPSDAPGGRHTSTTYLGPVFHGRVGPPWRRQGTAQSHCQAERRPRLQPSRHHEPLPDRAGRTSRWTGGKRHTGSRGQRPRLVRGDEMTTGRSAQVWPTALASCAPAAESGLPGHSLVPAQHYLGDSLGGVPVP